MSAAFAVALALAALMAAEEPAGEPGGREVGTAIHVRGTVDRIYRDDLRQLETGRAIRLYWTLQTHAESDLIMSFLPDRGVLLLGPESRLQLKERYVPDESKPLVDCRRLLFCDDPCRLRLARGQRDICKLTVETRAATIEALGTDFALVAHPLYGLLVEVFEGSLEVRIGDETVPLSAGGLILVRGGRTWLGLAAAEEAAPIGTFDVDPFPDPPALTPEQIFSRDPNVGIPR